MIPLTREGTLPADAVPARADGVILRQLIATLWRGKTWLILAAILGAVLAQAWLLQLATPLYRATATIALPSQQERVIADIESVLSGAGTDIASLNTEAEVLTSRRLVGRLVEEQGLQSDPEFNEALRPDVPWHPLTLLRAEGLIPPAVPLDAATIAARTVDAALEAITVTNKRQSLVFDIAVTTTEADKSARLANALAALYIDDQLQAAFEANARASEFLSARVAELRSQVEALQAERNAFLEQEIDVSPEALAASARQLREARARLSETRASADALAAEMEQLQALSGDPAAFAAATGDPQLARAVTRGAGDAVVEGYLDRLATRRTRADQQTATLAAGARELQARVDAQSAALIELQQLEQELGTVELLYESFLSRLKETAVQEGLRTNDTRLLSAAVARPPASPRPLLVTATAMALAMALAAAAMIWRELQFAGFRTTAALQAATGRAVLGAIPRIPGRTRRQAAFYTRKKPNSLPAEAVRNLRTSVMMSGREAGPQVLLMTSSVSGEGKTLLSMALAQNVTGLGKRVLLIEADIRRRTFSHYFDPGGRLTLPEAMADPGALAGSDLWIPEAGVDVLLGARASENAADLFASAAFEALITRARGMYDLIVIDSAPVLAVPDARLIRRVCDACLYVVKWDDTSETQLRQGLQMLDGPGLGVTGLVLNRIDPRQMRRYGYGGEYGYDKAASKYYG